MQDPQFHAAFIILQHLWNKEYEVCVATGCTMQYTSGTVKHVRKEVCLGFDEVLRDA